MVFRCIQALGTQSVELRQRLFAGILVIGDGCVIRGLRDMMERRLLHRLPPEDKVNPETPPGQGGRVEVLVASTGAWIGALSVLKCKLHPCRLLAIDRH